MGVEDFNLLNRFVLGGPDLALTGPNFGLLINSRTILSIQAKHASKSASAVRKIG
jgi:hypothetical protein